MENRLERVLVTGGSRGIGAGIVRCFRKEGYLTAFTYREREAEARALENETGAKAIRADSSSEADVERAIGEAEQALGGSVGILVNNAGIASYGLLTDLSFSDWNRMMAVNVGGAFLWCRAVIPGMVHRKAGRIILLSSVWGMVGASCEAAYSASKAAVIGLAKGLAKELGPSGIAVNAIAPGVVKTEMLASLDDSVLAGLCEDTPLGRLGTPEDIAASVLFLAGEGGAFMTGQVLSPNGGFVIN